MLLDVVMATSARAMSGGKTTLSISARLTPTATPVWGGGISTLQVLFVLRPRASAKPGERSATRPVLALGPQSTGWASTVFPFAETFTFVLLKKSLGVAE